MTYAYVLLCLASLIELTIRAALPTSIRKIIAILAASILIFGTVLLLVNHFSAWTIIVGVLTVYRLANLSRVIHDQNHSSYLQHIVWRSSYWLALYQAIVILVALLANREGMTIYEWLYALIVGQLLAAIVIITSTNRHLRTTKANVISETYADRDLPTLSVLVPARNETDDLNACLDSLVASSYPKLEILVLDDCSQNARTPEIIRSYAHDGVRFIAGTTPPRQWLAKNFAYQQLSDEANGEFLLFCGVDARFSPDSMRVLIQTLLSKKKTMLSIIPQNHSRAVSSLLSLLVQPSRYAWELSLPRRFFKRPPVLSTCWLIARTELESSGRFKAVSRSVSPERYFARFCANHQDGYSFLGSNQQLGVASSKSLLEQRATAVRMRYPQLHKRLEKTAVVSLLEVSVLVCPFVILIWAFLSSHWLSFVLSLTTCLLLLLFYGRIVNLTYQRFVWKSFIIEPVAALYDVCLLNYSLWKYEFDEVIWKDRNICVPVMRVIPRFPRLP
jgi:glycosyltransferase involved in cell wall biosynthesis